MIENSKNLSQDIEKIIISINNNIKNKNYNYISSQIANLNNLILNYLLALDYEIRSQNVVDNKFKIIKETINLNLQKIAEYLKTKDEKLISQVQSSLSEIYNLLFEPQNIETNDWNDRDEQKFFILLQQISELSNKVFTYYSKKQVLKEELINLTKEILNNIEKLP